MRVQRWGPTAPAGWPESTGARFSRHRRRAAWFEPTRGKPLTFLPCRRLGIATALVERAEEWCRARGAAHATMATTTSNAASLALFTGRFGYAPFRRPEFLGRPVHAHRLDIPGGHRVFQLPPPLAAAAYARLLAPQATEFLPADMPALLAHKLTLGTFVAIESNPDPSLPPSLAVLSIWDFTSSDC